MQEFSGWYTGKEAAKVIGKKSNKPVRSDYVFRLAKLGKIDSMMIGHTRLYKKEQVDSYQVEERGVKAARAKRGKASQKAEQEPEAVAL